MNPVVPIFYGRKCADFTRILPFFVFLYVKYLCLPESGLCINARIITEKASHQNEYDDSIVRQIVECIKVYADKHIEVIFGGGYTVEETVE